MNDDAFVFRRELPPDNLSFLLEWCFVSVILVYIRKDFTIRSKCDNLILKGSQKDEESDTDNPGCNSCSYQDGRLQKEENHVAVPSKNVPQSLVRVLRVKFVEEYEESIRSLASDYNSHVPVKKAAKALFDFFLHLCDFVCLN